MRLSRVVCSYAQEGISLSSWAPTDSFFRPLLALAFFLSRFSEAGLYDFPPFPLFFSSVKVQGAIAFFSLVLSSRSSAYRLSSLPSLRLGSGTRATSLILFV